VLNLFSFAHHGKHRVQAQLTERFVNESVLEGKLWGGGGGQGGEMTQTMYAHVNK
jgi:hypothetical protein